MSEDLYPTRTTTQIMRHRRHDPVVHCAPAERWNGPLDEVALSAFERDGYLWFEEFFSEERMQPFFDELNAMSRDPAFADDPRIIRDPNSAAIRSVFDMHRISEAFDALTRDPRILGMVEQLLGGSVYLFQSRINDKYGFQGKGFDWHSDFETWHAEDGMPRMRAISASLMLTDNNEFNGPIMLIPGSHQQFVPCRGHTPDNNWEHSLKAQEAGVPAAADLRALADARGITAPKGRAGSLLLFECNTLHASNANMSPWPRSNLFFVYNSVHNALRAPYAADNPRPAFLANRETPEALSMKDPFADQRVMR